MAQIQGRIPSDNRQTRKFDENVCGIFTRFLLVIPCAGQVGFLAVVPFFDSLLGRVSKI
jgi:hypothetical protein